MRMRVGSLAAIGLVLMLGCADVAIRKVPNRSDYSTWSDYDQRCVDNMCGLRFYRTRPYVVVKKPFVVSSKPYLVAAITSNDGKFVRIVGEGFPEVEHGSLKPSDVAGTLRLPPFLRAEITRAIPDGRVTSDSIVPAPGSGRDSGATAQGATISAPPLDSIAPHATEGDRPTGTATLRLQTELDAIATTKDLTTFFDLIYLPDFEEEYIVQPNTRLGSTDLSFTRGPGGELLAMGMRVDNSAITRPLVDAYTSFIKGGTAAAERALGWPVPGAAAQGAQMDKESRPVLTPDKLITLRMHVVKRATPGLYPILKASEIMEDRYHPRRINKGYAVGAGACDPYTEAAPDNDRCDDVCETHVVPVYPYSRVAYQVHTTVVFEHILTAETAGTVPGFAQGTPTPRAINGPTEAQLESIIRGELNAEKCCNECFDGADLEAWEPRDVPANAIQTMTIRLIPINPTVPPAVVIACADKLGPAINRTLNANIIFTWKP